MEEFFDRAGPWGRTMMCSTASVQVSLDAGDEGPGWSGYRWRWQLLHAIGPVLVAAFANSPLRGGRPTGWVSTRQAIWARLDPTRTRPPATPSRRGRPRPAGLARHRSPLRLGGVRARGRGHVRAAAGRADWTAPAGLTFRDWLRGAGAAAAHRRRPRLPPVHAVPAGTAARQLELRMIDAQPGDGWIVPLAVDRGLLDDPLAAEPAMAAAEAAGWQPARPSPLVARGPARPGRPRARRREPPRLLRGRGGGAGARRTRPRRCGRRWPPSPSAT